MKTIYFVRHGESEANAAGLASGSELDIPLTQKGKEQAVKIGQELKDKKIQLIVSSPMVRAVQTATVIANQIGYNPSKIITNRKFIERAFGIYSGKPDPDYIAAVTSDRPLHDSVESVEDMHRRVTEGLEWIQDLEADRILIVSHGGVSRILRLMHQQLPYSHMYKLDRLDNGALYEFEF